MDGETDGGKKRKERTDSFRSSEGVTQTHFLLTKVSFYSISDTCVFDKLNEKLRHHAVLYFGLG